MDLRNLSIKRKLTLITMLTSSVALILASGSFLLYDLVSFKQLLRQDLMTQAEIVAYNSAVAMAFQQASEANVTLSALMAKDDVVAAVLYDLDGNVFAKYVRSAATDVTLPKVLPREGYRFNGPYLDVFQVVSVHGDRDIHGEHHSDGDRLGILFLQSDMRQWNSRAKNYATILGVFVLVAGFFAWVISSKLQGVVSKPILHLEEAMRAVSMEKNYAVRAVKFYGDEIGRLIDGFNTMLVEIQHRDRALQRANDDLHTRTKELEEEVVNRKRTQEEFLKAKQAAEEANRAKSAFLANMSHELRTPLNAIIGYSEMLEEETRDAGNIDSAKDLQRIQAAGKHLLSLINDVLDLSKIEAGKMALHIEKFDLRPLIEEIVTTLGPAAEKNSNRLLAQSRGDLGSMRADITKVRQILFNLLSNACKFTDHGTVTFESERYRDKSEEWIRFRVSDTGIGITPEQQKNLFKEFAQADGSISRKYGGTGLGLAISARFVEMMNGHISAKSVPGEGSVFTVEIPVVVHAEPPEPLSPDEISGAAQQVSDAREADTTVLVIDDDVAVRDLMARHLSKQGFRVVCAESGDEGLRLAREIQPNVITLDVVMPGLNGWNVLSQLKSQSDLAGIPVIMVTIVDNEVMGFDLGASNYLVKPIDRDRLALLLEKYRVRPADGHHTDGTLEIAGRKS